MAKIEGRSKEKELTRKDVAAEIDAGEIVIGRKKRACPANLLELALKGADLKRQINVLREQLSGIDGKIMSGLTPMMLAEKSGTGHIIAGDVDCTVTIKDKVEISDAETLSNTLGGRFNDLVKSKVVYAPEKQLIALALDPDDPLSERVRECLTITEGQTSVTYKKV